MEKGDMPKRLRSFFSTSNKFQEKIVLLTYVPMITIFVVILVIVTMGNRFISMTLFHTSFPFVERLILHFSVFIELSLCLVIVGSLVASYIISHNLVGAYERIIREMDEIIAGKSVRPITVRPNDVMFNNLLKRVNVFIDAYVKRPKDKV